MYINKQPNVSCLAWLYGRLLARYQVRVIAWIWEALDCKLALVMVDAGPPLSVH